MQMIALIAESRSKLEKIMSITYKYSKKWRFTFNYDKCAVMVFNQYIESQIRYGNCSQECSCGYHWKLGDQLIKQVQTYKYLGVELDTRLTFGEFKKRIKEKARKNVSRIWSMGMYDGCLSVKACINLYQALVRSVCEYACEIWGDEKWEEGERVQREMGRRILRCNGKTTNEAVLGELGWWRLQTRRDFCKLKYWIRILTMDDSRLVKQVYRQSKEQYLNEGTRNWCYNIHRLVARYNLDELWDEERNVLYPPQGDNTQLYKSWVFVLYRRIHEIEENHWLKSMSRKPKLRTYQTIKSKLELETYLISEYQKIGRYIYTSIRTGSNSLRIETGRRKRPKEALKDRVCTACMNGEIEDEKHFVLDCKAYTTLRNNMTDKIRTNSRNLYNLDLIDRDERWRILMCPKSRKEEVLEPVKEFLRKAMKRRSDMLF